MKKINKLKFLKLFVQNKKLLDDSGCVLKLQADDVDEFKIGNKYFYKLSDNSCFKSAQSELCYNFLNSLPVNNSAVAYRSGLSYLNLFEPHRKGYFFMRLDVSSFFHSIQEELLRKCFSNYFKNEYIDEGEKQGLIDSFILLSTYRIPDTSPNERFRGKVVLPIGFQSSPVISNIVFRKIDILIQNFCSSKNIVYSRYADDMVFSSSSLSKFIHSESFYNEIKYLISIDGFKINKRKTIRSEHTISLNGYIINSKGVSSKSADIRISNKKTEIIRKLIHKLDKGVSDEEILTTLFDFKYTSKYFKYLPATPEYVEIYCMDQLNNKITGYRSFLISIIKFHDKYNCVDSLSILKYKKYIDILNAYIRKRVT